jgi:hypothetical protein
VAWKGTAARMQLAFKNWNEALQRSSVPSASPCSMATASPKPRPW